MAEGLARASAPPNVVVHSAGSKPSHVNPYAIQVLAEIGVDISGHTSKGMDDVPLDQAELAITLCAEEECPLLPGTVRRVSWAMPDPAMPDASETESMNAFRQARDVIKARLDKLWETFPEATP